MIFDTDSKPVKIDNCCTKSMSCSMDDFVPNSLKIDRNKNVHGYGGSLAPFAHQGTIQWSFKDDSGMRQTLSIPKSRYVPNSAVRLLSPQHLAQQRQDSYPLKHGTRCVTYDDRNKIQWDQRRITLTAKFDPAASNVATLWTAPGFKKMQHFEVTVMIPSRKSQLCYRAQKPKVRS
jgi:hypothetical protein